MTGTRFDLEVQPVLPTVLARLEKLANDLVYSWSRALKPLSRFDERIPIPLLLGAEDAPTIIATVRESG